MLSRDDESSLNDDEYDEVKKFEPTTTTCIEEDKASYSTLGSPRDSTPITPTPIPTMINVRHPSCLRESNFASIKRDDTFPPIKNIRKEPTQAFIANSFEPVPMNVLNELPSFDTFTDVDGFLKTQGYNDLVGLPLNRTPSELRNKEEQRYLRILKTHADGDDPMFSSINLHRILFTNQQYDLTDEELELPTQLLHKNDKNAHACAVKTWHRTLHKDLDPQKLRPFLGFRPTEIVRKTLANTTQLARLII